MILIYSRWIKFEEDVEEGGNRWSKPHVATLSLHSLFELRSLILNGTVILDMEASSMEQIADLVLDNLINNNGLPLDKKEKVREALLKRHRHQHQRKHHGLPFIRSFNEMRNHSTSKSMSNRFYITFEIYYGLSFLEEKTVFCIRFFVKKFFDVTRINNNSHLVFPVFCQSPLYNQFWTPPIYKMPP